MKKLQYIYLISFFYIGGISINLTDVREDYKITGGGTSGYSGKFYLKHEIAVDSTFALHDLKQIAIKMARKVNYKSLDKTLIVLYTINKKGYYLIEVKNLFRPHDSMIISKL